MSNAATKVRIGHVYYSGNVIDPHMDRVEFAGENFVRVSYVGRAKSGPPPAPGAQRSIKMDVFRACYYESYDGMIAAYAASDGPGNPFAGAQLPGGR